MRFPARTAALLAALVAVIAGSLTVASAVPAQARSGSVVRLPRAATTGDVYGDVRGDATMYLRRLALMHDSLRGAARKQADASLARPALTSEQETCSGQEPSPLAVVPICVHYSAVGASADSPTSPEWVTTVLHTLEHVYSFYQSSGYKMPESDGTRGGDARTDIYLANIGAQGYYGYCAPEPVAGSAAHHTPAFCVLDNNFSEFNRGTPLTNLEVTAAHEFFHAVQFGYDATEDPWFMESTAVWVEDQVYDDINDNTQYLPFGPLKKPATSLDKNTTFGVYGGWIFFRWVSEHRPQLQGQMPKIVLSMWQRAAADGSTKDRYSLQAIKSALKSAHLPLRSAFAKFAAANRNARHTYSEGAANHYPIGKPTKKYTVRSTRHLSGSARVDHLAAATERFVPKGASFKSKHAKLHVGLDMANRSRGTGAVATVFLRGGGTKVKVIHLSKTGRGAVTVPFSTKTVKRVELTMTNASTRMRCGTNGLYSCNGQPKDMNQLEKFSAQAHRG